MRIFQEQYPKLRIAGFRNGYFSSDAEMNKEASHIVELNPDFLIVGMGALMQEKFLLKVKDGLPRHRLYVWWLCSPNGNE